MMMVGASCDIDKSDMRVVAVIVLVGCFFMWIGGKDYEYEAETEAQEEKDRVYCELDAHALFSSIADNVRYALWKKYICKNRRRN